MNHIINKLATLIVLSLILVVQNVQAYNLELAVHLSAEPQEYSQESVSLSVPSFNHEPMLDFKALSSAAPLTNESLQGDSDADFSPSLFENEDVSDDEQFIFLADYTSSPIAVNAVEKQIQLFTEIFPDKFTQWLERSGRYMDLMKSILRVNGLPEDLVFLPLIESGFNPYAFSRAKAAGPWQFIKGTGKKYGLKINFWVDERRDPVKSTEAAAKYLKELYDRFDSWTLAMAAYNAGEGKITRALRRSKVDDYWPLLKSRYLRSETKNYVAKFIAARLIAADPEGYGFGDLEYHDPFEFDEVEVSSPVDLDVIADAAETSLEVIKELNPELRTWCTPLESPTYVVRIPKGATEKFLSNLERIPEDQRFTLKAYRLKRGETLTSVAKKEVVPLEILLAINGVSKSSAVKPGNIIYLPPRDKITLCKEIVKSQKAHSRRKKSKRLVT